MSENDKNLRDQLNVSISNAPRTSEEIEDRRRAAARRQRVRIDVDSDSMAREDRYLEPQLDRHTQAAIFKRELFVKPQEETPIPSSTSPASGGDLSNVKDVQNYGNVHLKQIADLAEKASSRRYVGESRNKEVRVAVDGNGGLLSMGVSHRMLRKEQSRIVSSHIIAAIEQARTKASSDWLTEFQDGLR
ncbi:YbaB/EbfC family nucleoid-associated protein [Spirillospora sp. NPDC046719]